MKIRKVFGRVKVEIEGRMVNFELMKDGLYVREKWSREYTKVGFDFLKNMVSGQFQLPLGIETKRVEKEEKEVAEKSAEEGWEKA